MTAHDSSPAAEAFRRSLDRAVARGRAGRLVAIVGCWTTCAAALWCAVVAVGQGTGAGVAGGAAAPVATWTVVAVVASLVTAAIFRPTVRAGRWPTRLAVALETERRDPQLGERLSRAVGFLDEAATNRREPPADAALAGGLRRLAIEQARAALPGRLAVPGETADLKWIAAGVLAAVAAAVTTVVVPRPWAAGQQEGNERGAVPAPQTGTAVDAAAPPSAAARAALARRLRAAAAVERRVADMAAALFAEAPGARRESLPRDQQARLDRLAAVQADICGAVRAVRAELPGLAATPAARIAACLGELDAFSSVGGERIGGHVALNQLGLAGDRAASAAIALAAAANAVVETALSPETEGRAADEPRLVRAALVLDELSITAQQAVPGTATPAHGRARSGEPAGSAAAATGGFVGPSRAPGGGAAAAETPTTSPAQTAAGESAEPSPGGSAPATAAAPSPPRPADRGWRPPSPRQSDVRPVTAAVPEDAPAAYRQAVAEYYRLLRPPLMPAAAGTDSGRRPLQQ